MLCQSIKVWKGVKSHWKAQGLQLLTVQPQMKLRAINPGQLKSVNHKQKNRHSKLKAARFCIFKQKGSGLQNIWWGAWSWSYMEKAHALTILNFSFRLIHSREQELWAQKKSYWHQSYDTFTARKNRNVFYHQNYFYFLSKQKLP